MMMRKDTMRIIALLICILAIPVHITALEQDNMIEYLLRKVAELEKNQHECSSYQSKMILELNYLKNKLQQSERRLSELESIVYDMRSDDYTENLDVTIENDTLDKPGRENFTKVITAGKEIGSSPQHKGMRSHKLGILRRESRGIATKQIGFCATIENIIASIHPNEIVHFDTVLLDEGNGFNKQTGIFTCPLSGIYFFTVSLMTSHGYTTFVHLIVNGEIRANIYADGGGSWDQGSISSIVRCETGQNVWISVYGGTYIYGDRYTSFSGFLLWGDGSS